MRDGYTIIRLIIIKIFIHHMATNRAVAKNLIWGIQ